MRWRVIFMVSVSVFPWWGLWGRWKVFRPSPTGGEEMLAEILLTQDQPKCHEPVMPPSVPGRQLWWSDALLTLSRPRIKKFRKKVRFSLTLCVLTLCAFVQYFTCFCICGQRLLWDLRQSLAVTNFSVILFILLIIPCDVLQLSLVFLLCCWIPVSLLSELGQRVQLSHTECW